MLPSRECPSCLKRPGRKPTSLIPAFLLALPFQLRPHGCANLLSASLGPGFEPAHHSPLLHCPPGPLASLLSPPSAPYTTAKAMFLEHKSQSRDLATSMSVFLSCSCLHHTFISPPPSFHLARSVLDALRSLPRCHFLCTGFSEPSQHSCQRAVPPTVFRVCDTVPSLLDACLHPIGHARPR